MINTFQVATFGGFFLSKGVIIGNLAVSPQEGWYGITYIPNGRFICGFKSAANTIRCAKELSQINDLPNETEFAMKIITRFPNHEY